MARLRLEINLLTGARVRTVGSRRLNGENFATTIIKDVGLRYAASRFNDLKTSLSSQLRPVVLREIEHVARKYRELIVGSAGVRAAMFTLTPATYESGVREAVTRPRWAPLTPHYLAQKAREGRSPNHFLYTGALGNSMNRASTWVNMFGPVKVRVVRTGGDTPQAVADYTNSFASRRGGTDIRFDVAKIEVRALGKITANMLPALAGGEVGFARDRNHGLIGLIYGGDEELGYRLSGNSKTTPYRSTVEPFLGFVLTRSIPAAVSAKIRSTLPGSTVEYLGQSVRRAR